MQGPPTKVELQTLRAAVEEWVADPTVAGGQSAWVWLASRLQTRRPGWVTALVKTLVADDENARLALSRHFVPTPAVMDEEDGLCDDSDGGHVDGADGGGAGEVHAPPDEPAAEEDVASYELGGGSLIIAEDVMEEAARQRINSIQLAEGLRASLYDGADTRGTRASLCDDSDGRHVDADEGGASEVPAPADEPAAEEDVASYEVRAEDDMEAGADTRGNPAYPPPPVAPTWHRQVGGCVTCAGVFPDYAPPGDVLQPRDALPDIPEVDGSSGLVGLIENLTPGESELLHSCTQPSGVLRCCTLFTPSPRVCFSRSLKHIVSRY